MPAQHARLIGSPFWEYAALPTRARVHLGWIPTSTSALQFALRLGATQLAGDLTLVGVYYTNIYQGHETGFGSPGAGPGTRSSLVGVRAMIRLPRVLRVSGCMQTLYMYTTDIIERDRAHPGLFCMVFNPPCSGVNLTKTAIAPERGARLFHVSGCLIK